VIEQARREYAEVLRRRVRGPNQLAHYLSGEVYPEGQVVRFR
jgi:hypothetical protein